MENRSRCNHKGPNTTSPVANYDPTGERVVGAGAEQRRWTVKWRCASLLWVRGALEFYAVTFWMFAADECHTTDAVYLVAFKNSPRINLDNHRFRMNNTISIEWLGRDRTLHCFAALNSNWNAKPFWTMHNSAILFHVLRALGKLRNL